MNKQAVGEDFRITVLPARDDFLAQIEKRLNDNGFTTHRHDHDKSFSLLKIAVTTPDGKYSHQVNLYHDQNTKLVEVEHNGTGATEHSAFSSKALAHETSDLALGFCAFLSLNEETPLRRDLENMMNNLPRAKVTETTMMPSQKYQKFKSRRSDHIGLHAV